MSRLFEKTTELSSEAQVARKIGPAGAVALKGTGISATTTLRANAFFTNNWNRIKKFGKSIPSYFQKPYTMNKIVLYSIIVVALLIGGIFLYRNVTMKKEGFEDSVAQERAFDIVNSIKINQTIDVNEDDNKLVNIQPVTFKQAAYLGVDTFDDDLGVLEQLRAGSRFFFLQIDYLEKDLGTGFDKPFEPTLVWRNNAERMTSKNGASINKIATSIKGYFNNDNVPNFNSPIVLFLHFIRVPYSITDTSNYKSYFNKVHQLLQPIESLLVKGYSKASKESDLFSKKFTEFNKQIIVGTNVDTSVMNSGIELDKYIHFRYYQMDDSTIDKVDISDIQTNKDKLNALIFNADYLLSLKDTETFLKQNRSKFIVAKPKNDQQLKKDEIDKLLNKLNVNVVLHDYFSDTKENVVGIYELYNKSSYKLKSVF